MRTVHTTVITAKNAGLAEGTYEYLLLVNGNPQDDISSLTTPQEDLALFMKDGKIQKNSVKSPISRKERTRP